MNKNIGLTQSFVVVLLFFSVVVGYQPSCYASPPESIQLMYNKDTQTLIDQEVKKIVNKCYQDAKAMIEEHMDVLHKCAALLLEKERINRVEFEALFDAENAT